MSKRIWKMSHGYGVITREPREWLEDKKLIVKRCDKNNDQVRNFRDNVKEGDLFYLCYTNRLRLIGRITSDEFLPYPSDAPHININDVDPSYTGPVFYTRPYEILFEATNNDPYRGPSKIWAPNGQSTFKKIEDDGDLANFEDWILQPFFGKTLADLFGDDVVAKPRNSQIPTQEDTAMPYKEEIQKNTILYGPPGTGKTYNTVVYAVAICLNMTKNEVEEKGYDWARAEYDKLVRDGRVCFTTFHQSYGYEDFIEGIKPRTKKGQVEYNTENGIFKDFCEAHSFDAAWNSLLDRVKTGNKEFTVYEEEDSFHRTLRWDDYSKFKDVTHPSMKDHYADYEHTKGIYSGAFRRPSNGNTQEFINSAGILGELLRNYDLGKKCVFIIDEINRGNISKIFGELITLIEDDKRERDSVVLPYTKEPFTVPRNVYILGTMNTADRSIALMDTALRRRFNFVEMMPEAETLKNATVGSISVGALLKAINDRIEYLYDREHTIGHAYFKEFIKGEGDLNTLRSIFKNRIIPLLQEYFYDDYEKISLVLGDQAVASDAERFVIKVRVPAEFANTLYDEGEKFRINKDIFDPTKCSDAAFEKRLTAICGKAQPRQDDATDA